MRAPCSPGCVLRIVTPVSLIAQPRGRWESPNAGYQLTGTARFKKGTRVEPIPTKMPENALRKRDRANGQGVRVLTVDDQAVFRSVAHDVIAATPGFEPAGEAESGEEALAEVARLNPDLVLIDVRMPGIGGIEAGRRIAAAHPGTVVVLISIEDTEEIARGAHLGGVAALVRKQDFGPTLLRRLWDAHGGSRPRSSSRG